MNSKELNELAEDIISLQFEYEPHEVIRRIDDYLEHQGPDDLTWEERDALFRTIWNSLHQ